MYFLLRGCKKIQITVGKRCHVSEYIESLRCACPAFAQMQIWDVLVSLSSKHLFAIKNGGKLLRTGLGPASVSIIVVTTIMLAFFKGPLKRLLRYRFWKKDLDRVSQNLYRTSIRLGSSADPVTVDVWISLIGK